MKRDGNGSINQVVGSRRTAIYKPTARSRITNGKHLLPGIDGRSVWVRRFRDVIALHIQDKGGDDNISEAERAIIRRAACLIVELERLEMRFANRGGASPTDFAEYGRGANTLRRLLESVGIQRRARDITPDPLDYAREREDAGP